MKLAKHKTRCQKTPEILNLGREDPKSWESSRRKRSRHRIVAFRFGIGDEVLSAGWRSTHYRASRDPISFRQCQSSSQYLECERLQPMIHSARNLYPLSSFTCPLGYRIRQATLCENRESLPEAPDPQKLLKQHGPAHDQVPRPATPHPR